MMKHEFEDLIKGLVTPEVWEAIDTVYTWHPSISNTVGKMQMAKLYKDFGYDFIKAMLPQATAIIKADNRRRETLQDIDKHKAAADAEKKTLYDQYCQQCEDIDNRYGLEIADLMQELEAYKRQLDRLNGGDSE